MTLVDMLPFVDIMAIDIMPFLTWKLGVLVSLVLTQMIYAYQH